MMEVLMTAGAMMCKAPVKSSPLQANTFSDQMPILLPNEQCTVGKELGDSLINNNNNSNNY